MKDSHAYRHADARIFKPLDLFLVLFVDYFFLKTHMPAVMHAHTKHRVTWCF
jgi:hypothetical protein